MSIPTRKQIHDAYDALETLTNTCIHGGDLAEELQELVLRALPPKPHPTMADVEWDNEKHRFAEAEHPDYGKVIMLQRDLNTGRVRVLLTDYGEFHMPYALPQNLTPTGRRYTLTEVQDD